MFWGKQSGKSGADNSVEDLNDYISWLRSNKKWKIKILKCFKDSKLSKGKGGKSTDNWLFI